jgi:hypothetical protein
LSLTKRIASRIMSTTTVGALTAWGWKAVQQKERRSVRATGLPVEDLDAVADYSVVRDLGHLAPGKCAL